LAFPLPARLEMFTKSVAFFLLPAFAAAQYGGGPAPASGGSSTAAAAAVAPTAPANTAGQINVNVGLQGAFAFSPPNITAPVGTLVTFYFPGGAIPHSVTESSFANPCTYLAASNSSTAAGFDSGLVTSPATFTINVTDTNPIWFHCKAPTHCSVTGMVGSINAPATGNTFDVFQSAAKALGSSAPTETDNGPVTGGVGAVATAGPTSDTGSSSGTTKSSATKVVASAGFALLSAAIAFCMV